MRCCVCSAPVREPRVVVLGDVHDTLETTFGPIPFVGLRVRRVPVCRAVYCAYRVRAETNNADTP